MTRVYFVRHAKPDFSVKDDLTRPLTEEGEKACKKVTEFLSDKAITKAFSSPYKRSINTIRDFTERADLEITLIHDFRERKVDEGWIEDLKDFNKFVENQWNDFDYKLAGGECLNEVQKRNINALEKVLEEGADSNIVVGTHGTALSTIINHYKKDFGYAEFYRIKGLMPFIVCMTFDGQDIVSIEEFEVV